jgi:hypothetical protein
LPSKLRSFPVRSTKQRQRYPQPEQLTGGLKQKVEFVIILVQRHAMNGVHVARGVYPFQLTHRRQGPACRHDKRRIGTTLRHGTSSLALASVKGPNL